MEADTGSSLSSMFAFAKLQGFVLSSGVENEKEGKRRVRFAISSAFTVVGRRIEKLRG